jgi:1,4-dihydroxy-2-naphthoate octaprenyltransferase
MTTPLKLWVAGARPRTLPAAVVPVVVGTAAGYVATGHSFTLVAATGTLTQIANAHGKE